jgi:predicted lipase
MSADLLFMAMKQSLKVTGRDILVEYTTDRLWVAFPGSSSKDDWQNNLDATLVDHVSGSRVHRGFLTEFHQAVPNINAAMTQHHEGQTVALCGHSLGGAVALLASLYLHAQGYTVEVYTFGAPKVGDSGFRRAVQDTNIPVTNVALDRDPVPHIPFWNKRVGGFLWIDHDGYPLSRPTCFWTQLLFWLGFRRMDLTDHLPNRYMAAIVALNNHVGSGIRKARTVK